MQTVQRPDGSWWIADVPGTIGGCGPYGTRAEAESDRVGMSRFFRHENDREWFEGAGTIHQKEKTGGRR